ncbi:hypothetical protein MKW92_009911, partial [Papaver armeniacum]
VSAGDPVSDMLGGLLVSNPDAGATSGNPLDGLLGDNNNPLDALLGANNPLDALLGSNPDADTRVQPVGGRKIGPLGR